MGGVEVGCDEKVWCAVVWCGESDGERGEKKIGCVRGWVCEEWQWGVE